VFCFHHAGGSATDFFRWQELVNPRYEVICVQLPGRGARLRDPLLSDAQIVADHVLESLLPLIDRDYVLVGHSLGGLIAYEVAKRLQRAECRMPLRIVACARAAPSLNTTERTHEYPRERFVESLRQYGALPERVLEDRDLLDFFLPMLRSDVKTYETYRYDGSEPLNCPITALVGRDDPVVHLERVRGWAQESQVSCEFDVVPGGHFFPKTHAQAAVARAFAGL
jgi:surfactin synthase thioesterase subunit